VFGMPDFAMFRVPVTINDRVYWRHDGQVLIGFELHRLDLKMRPLARTPCQRTVELEAKRLLDTSNPAKLINRVFTILDNWPQLLIEARMLIHDKRMLEDPGPLQNFGSRAPCDGQVEHTSIPTF